jgi:hypothetical protein
MMYLKESELRLLPLSPSASCVSPINIRWEMHTFLLVLFKKGKSNTLKEKNRMSDLHKFRKLLELSVVKGEWWILTWILF